MIIYNKQNQQICTIAVDDDSYRYRAIMQAKKVELRYSLPEHVEIPVGSYIEFQGERYTLWHPENFKKKGTREFEYTVTFGGNEEILSKYKFKLLSQKPYQLKFPLTAIPRMFIQLLVDNLNLYDEGWTVGSCIEATEKPISFSHEDCYAVLSRLASEFNTEWEIVGKAIHFKKVEKFKDEPIALSYGKGNGFVPGVGRSNQGDKRPITLLYVQGGERNIDYTTYNSQTLLLPKSQELEYEKRRYKTDADGMYITRADRELIDHNEDSFDASNIHPSRIGEVTAVTTEAGKDTEGKPVTFYNIVDTTIPDALNYRDCRLNGSKATIIFQSGVLTGREFDIVQTDDDLTGYDHTKKTFKLVPLSENNLTLPNEHLKPSVGDKYAVFNISLPTAYVCDNTTKSGASWEMFREAVRYLYENEEEQFTFSGELNGIWAKKNWLAIGGKLIPGGYVDFSDTQFQPDGILIRITGVTDYINKPHSPKLELSNTPVAGFLADDMGKIDGNEVTTDKKHKEALSLTQRRWRDMQETGKMLEKAIEGFSAAINPITVSTMQVRVGSEQLQYRFVTNKTTPKEYTPDFVMNNDSRVFTAPGGIVQHMTLGIDSISVSHSASEYQFWDIESYTSPYLSEDKTAYYLYLKCRKDGSTGNFLLSKEPHKIEEGSDYYFLVGTLGTEFEGQRSFEAVYGYTEILPGRMTIGLIKSSDGETYFNLAEGEIGGKIVFKAGSSGYDNISDRPNLQPIYDGVSDALTDAENASNAANNAAGIANGKSKVFYYQPPSGMKVNDLWVDGTHIRRWNGSSWEFASAYDNTETRISGGLVTTGAVAVGPSSGNTGGIAGSGSIRIWSGAAVSTDGVPQGSPTFRVYDSGAVHGRNSIICEDANGDPSCGFSSQGTSPGSSTDPGNPGSIRIWVGGGSPEAANFKVGMSGIVYCPMIVFDSDSRLYNGALSLQNDGQIVLRARSSACEAQLITSPSLGGSVMRIKDIYESGSNWDKKAAVSINIGQSAYANVPRAWIDCDHAEGWGSGFVVESRYFGDANAMERTCIKAYRMPSTNHLDLLGPAGNRYQVGWDENTSMFYRY